jgi:hypothetical protein
MSISDELFWKASMEAIEEGYVDQPIVAVYVPERDGNLQPLVDMDVNGASVHYREWTGTTGMEGMQQILEHRHKVDEKVRAQAEDDAALLAMTHDDYSLFVLSPAVDPSWYETLGEVDELTGVLLTGNLDEYDVKVVEKLEEKLGMESVFTETAKACVCIERILHRRGVR